ncbi:hypothetical protein [Salinibaculum rarum]|uniref:hypothetical protein n=1 Tax=Salinibaculum rarum TaxID=3058903 RepID=UPI00265E9A8B|nr:hypothetical protein [Salinibaculum sp. KK48]
MVKNSIIRYFKLNILFEVWDLESIPDKSGNIFIAAKIDQQMEHSVNTQNINKFDAIWPPKPRSEKSLMVFYSVAVRNGITPQEP